MVVSLGAQGALAADPPADRVLQADRYTSEKGRGLAQKYQGQLRDLNAKVFQCMPWLEVKKEGIGFYKPKHDATEGGSQLGGSGTNTYFHVLAVVPF